MIRLIVAFGLAFVNDPRAGLGTAASALLDAGLDVVHLSGLAAGGGSSVNNYNYNIEAAPGLAHEYAKQMADQAVKRSQDMNAAYGV